MRIANSYADIRQNGAEFYCSCESHTQQKSPSRVQLQLEIFAQKEDTLDYYAKLDMNERLKKNPLYEILFGAGNPDQLREEVKVLLLLRFRFYL